MAAHRRLHALLALAVAAGMLLAAAPAYGQLIDGDGWRDRLGDEPAPQPAPAPAPAEDPVPEPVPQPAPAPEPEPEPEPEPAPAPAPSSEPQQQPEGQAEAQPAPTGEPPPPPSAPPAAGADQAPPPGGGDDGPTSGPRTIPAEAQAAMDRITRSPANSSEALYEAVQQLVQLGLSEEEAIRIGFGRFPVAGVANFVHDWYFPRWGPGFRFHLGTDIFADHGTPVRSPVDGTVRAGSGSLGGLYVKVFQPDGTYFYMAHLSGLVEGFVNGMEVATGDIVGYVGNSGNARSTPPHVHLGIYTAGGEPTDPKPVLDQMLAEAMAALPGIVEQVRAQRPVAQPSPTARVPSSLLASSLLRPVIEGRALGGLEAAALFEAVGNPSSGGLAVAEAEATRVASAIDWEARAARDRAERDVVERVAELFRLSLGPLGR